MRRFFAVVVMGLIATRTYANPCTNLEYTEAQAAGLVAALQQTNGSESELTSAKAQLEQASSALAQCRQQWGDNHHRCEEIQDGIRENKEYLAKLRQAGAIQAQIAAAEQNLSLSQDSLDQCLNGPTRKAVAALLAGRARANARLEAQRKADNKRALFDRLRNDPTILRAFLSANVCGGQEEQEAARKEIAKEKKYSRIGGSIDLRAMHDLQDRLRSADERIEKNKAALKQRKLKPYACTDNNVKQVMVCHDPSEYQEDAASEWNCTSVASAMELYANEFYDGE